MIINLMSSPRNVSTAFMYSFAQRLDTSVIDEPFYGYYLSKVKDTRHPGYKEILDTMPSSFDPVVDQIQEHSDKSPVVFLKNMTHHFIGDSFSFLKDWQNIIFIRDPKEIIRSFAKVIPNPKMSDVGVQMQLELFEYLIENSIHQPIVLDSKDLLKSPEKILKKLCNQLRIPFSANMLTWQSGPKREDGVWAKYWYTNVHKSTGFVQHVSETIHSSDKLSDLADQANIYYLELSKHKLTI